VSQLHITRLPGISIRLHSQHTPYQSSVDPSNPTNVQVDVPRGDSAKEPLPDRHDGYQWTALSVTTVGALLASIQGSALLIALPNILTELHINFFTIIIVTLQWKADSTQF